MDISTTTGHSMQGAEILYHTVSLFNIHLFSTVVGPCALKSAKSPISLTRLRTESVAH